MQNPRKYGSPPYTVSVLHGGPGAPGMMKLVAESLSTDFGVLEPIQTADSLNGQVEELVSILEDHSVIHAILVGSSWGAMLGYIVAARYPSLVKKLILVGCAVMEDKYAEKISETRLNRLSAEDRIEAEKLFKLFEDPSMDDSSGAFRRIGEIIDKADSYDSTGESLGVIETQHDVFAKVWGDAKALRTSGEMVEMGNLIECPVVAIHGDHDPHPVEGVEAPLRKTVKDFRIIVLEKCGHIPWIEKHAKDEFYRILREEIRN